MYPGSALVDKILIIPTILQLLGGLFAIYVLLIFLPLFVQVMLNIFISVIRSQLKFDIRPMIDLILFPGSLLRICITWFVLTLFGFKNQLVFRMPDVGDSATILNKSYGGLTWYSFQVNSFRKKHSPIKMAIIMSLASYAVVPVFVIMLLFSNAILLSLYLILPAHLVLPLFNFSLISIGIGGMPVPEETLAVVYALMYSHPHICLHIFFSFLGSIIITPYVGAEIGFILFVGMINIGILINKTMDPGVDEDTIDEMVSAFILG